MAIQSFSVGQVLTAAQVNALQANDYNQTVSNKTASYTLVAADKGTRIAMSSTSATTITVNTGLFSAGDTLFIQNLNTGVSTITAGTATVTTSASLALAQWEGGTLYFTSTSAAIFIKGAGAAAASGGMTLLSTTTLSGSSTTISGISGSYKQLLFILSDITSSVNSSLTMQVNGGTTGIYGLIGLNKDGAVGSTVVANSATSWQLTTATSIRDSDSEADGYIYFTDYSDTNKRKNGYYGWSYIGVGNVRQAKFANLNVDDNNAITSVTFIAGSGTFQLGTIKTYGVN